MTQQPSYYEYDPKTPITCSQCQWTGIAEGHEEFFRELLEVTCPECGSIHLVVSYPTTAETRKAAADGNTRARKDLPVAERIDRRLGHAKAQELKRPEQLPDLPGSAWRIDWDFDDRDGEHRTVLEWEGQEIWRELAFFEGYTRFEKVFEILRRRYGSGLRELRPTPGSKLFLYGDSLSAHRIIERLNASLQAS